LNKRGEKRLSAITKYNRNVNLSFGKLIQIDAEIWILEWILYGKSLVIIYKVKSVN